MDAVEINLVFSNHSFNFASSKTLSYNEKTIFDFARSRRFGDGFLLWRKGR